VIVAVTQSQSYLLNNQKKNTMKINLKKAFLIAGLGIGLASANLSAQPDECYHCFEREIGCGNGTYDPTSTYCTFWLDVCYSGCSV
jgi:hypothetical protein